MQFALGILLWAGKHGVEVHSIPGSLVTMPNFLSQHHILPARESDVDLVLSPRIQWRTRTSPPDRRDKACASRLVGPGCSLSFFYRRWFARGVWWSPAGGMVRSLCLAKRGITPKTCGNLMFSQARKRLQAFATICQLLIIGTCHTHMHARTHLSRLNKQRARSKTDSQRPGRRRALPIRFPGAGPSGGGVRRAFWMIWPVCRSISSGYCVAWDDRIPQGVLCFPSLSCFPSHGTRWERGTWGGRREV